MRVFVLCLAIAVMGVSACNSRYNPVNWFDGSEEVDVEGGATANPLIPAKSGFVSKPDEVYPGITVAKITELKVERVADGALIRAAGVAYVQGAFSVKLMPQNDGKPVKGVLTYDLMAIHPASGFRGGADNTRLVTVAHSLTDQQLAGVRTIKVVAIENARQARR
ncbi:hypothetical protein SAMN05444000_12313 [Shimia gijangensis]|uniref:Lipoprotein n=1 Tax=Shimia gijangensis TaxID=1470563 RepID=A0A1M6QT76_9RHOB|nr:hypothetical protein [Shimia gijangensis]SHK23519.1 hypothetical protein SAMN05444000_12313 [Shimia gijangensis]